AMQGLLEGETSLLIGTFAITETLTSSGHLRALAVTGPNRSPHLPAVPTTREAGLPGFNAVRRYGLLVPAGTSRSLLVKLNRVMREAMATTDPVSKVARFGVEPTPSTSEEYASMIDREI